MRVYQTLRFGPDEFEHMVRAMRWSSILYSMQLTPDEQQAAAHLGEKKFSYNLSTLKLTFRVWHKVMLEIKRRINEFDENILALESAGEIPQPPPVEGERKLVPLIVNPLQFFKDMRENMITGEAEVLTALNQLEKGLETLSPDPDSEWD